MQDELQGLEFFFSDWLRRLQTDTQHSLTTLQASVDAQGKDSARHEQDLQMASQNLQLLDMLLRSKTDALELKLSRGLSNVVVVRS